MWRSQHFETQTPNDIFFRILSERVTISIAESPARKCRLRGFPCWGDRAALCQPFPSDGAAIHTDVHSGHTPPGTVRGVGGAAGAHPPIDILLPTPLERTSKPSLFFPVSLSLLPKWLRFKDDFFLAPHYSYLSRMHPSQFPAWPATKLIAESDTAVHTLIAILRAKRSDHFPAMPLLCCPLLFYIFLSATVSCDNLLWISSEKKYSKPLMWVWLFVWLTSPALRAEGC